MCGVELVPVERLKPAGYNPRRADAERLALVRLSLSRLGFLLPIVATPDGEILSGHQRHAVAMSMGARQVPVMFVDISQERRRSWMPSPIPPWCDGSCRTMWFGRYRCASCVRRMYRRSSAWCTTGLKSILS